MLAFAAPSFGKPSTERDNHPAEGSYLHICQCEGDVTPEAAAPFRDGAAVVANFRYFGGLRVTMQYNYQDLGHLNSGAVVRVDLEGDEVNVRLLDQSNYRSFQAGRGCRGFGGHYKASPAVFTIPTYDHWYVVIDYGGGPGRGRAAVQVFNN